MQPEKINEILAEVKKNGERVDYNKRIFNILEGNLLPEILSSLEKTLSPKAFKLSTERAAPINVLKRIINKLSRLYAEPPQRTAKEPDETDQELIEYYTEETKINSIMGEANEYFNAMKYVLLQPFYEKDDEGVYYPRLRVLPPHNFFIYSDDSINPMKPTAIVIYSKYKKVVDNKGTVEEREAFDIYTKDEFVSVDADGQPIPERMEKNNGVNPFGEIPFVYINRSRQSLIPQRDTDTLQMTTLIPILLTDLNFATQFQSHSLIYAIDIVEGALDQNPNAFWFLKGVDREGSAPQIGAIKPEVDVEKVVNLIREQLALWLESRNIKPGKGGALTPDSVASGIALMIEEMDTTEDRKQQIPFFKEAESQLWYLFKIMQNYYFPQTEKKAKFSDKFEIQTNFGEQSLIEDKNQKIDRIGKELSSRLTTRKKAIMELNPHLTEDEAKKLLEEIDSENTVEITREPMEGKNGGIGTNEDESDSEDETEVETNDVSVSSSGKKEKEKGKGKTGTNNQNLK